jgi:phospholipase C
MFEVVTHSGFSSGGILTDIGAPGVNSSLTINLEAETGGLSLDSTVNGPVTLTLTPPPGDSVPSSFPATETLASGQATFSVKFPEAGYWRIKAQGPDGSLGYVTVDVAVTPDTAP